MHIEDVLYSAGLVPVLKIDRAETALPLSRALLAGGLPVVEITFRTAAAAESIALVARDLPEMLVGAGTILSIDQAQAAIEAGASFLVAPGFNPELVSWCVQKNIPIYPGCATASEVDAAARLGLLVVKFFPAEQSGGVAKIKALSGPYPAMRFMPTGGISFKNLAKYLASPKVIACGGAFMAPDDLIAQGAWDKISALTRQAAAAAQGFTLARVGLYGQSAEEARTLGEELASLTGLGLGDAGGSFLVGSDLEVAKEPGPFTARLDYTVLNVERSVRRLLAKGFKLDEKTIERDAHGAIVSVYLKKDFSGYGLRLMAEI